MTIRHTRQDSGITDGKLANTEDEINLDASIEEHPLPSSM